LPHGRNTEGETLAPNYHKTFRDVVVMKIVSLEMRRSGRVLSKVRREEAMTARDGTRVHDPAKAEAGESTGGLLRTAPRPKPARVPRPATVPRLAMAPRPAAVANAVRVPVTVPIPAMVPRPAMARLAKARLATAPRCSIF